MNIKNIILFSFVSIVHYNAHTMEIACSNSDEAASKMVLTQQFQIFEQARQRHYKCDTHDTKIILNDALDQLLKTNETKVLLKLIRQELKLPSKAMFSKNVLEKYQTLKRTPPYEEYETIITYSPNSDGIHDGIDPCLSNILLTEEWKEFFFAMRQEKDIINSIILSEEWVAKRKYNLFPFIKPTQNNKLLQINLFMFLFETLDMQLLLMENQ